MKVSNIDRCFLADSRSTPDRVMASYYNGSKRYAETHVNNKEVVSAVHLGVFVNNRSTFVTYSVCSHPMIGT